MTVYVLTVEDEVVGVYDEYMKAYDVGCSKYHGDFDIEEFEVEQPLKLRVHKKYVSQRKGYKCNQKVITTSQSTNLPVFLFQTDNSLSRGTLINPLESGFGRYIPLSI